jgi:hypothetical protein
MQTAAHRTQIYLTKEQYQYLRQQAEKNRSSIAGIIRELIDQRLPKDNDYKDNPLFSLSDDSLKMGRNKGSRRHDDYIYGRKK